MKLKGVRLVMIYLIFEIIMGVHVQAKYQKSDFKFKHVTLEQGLPGLNIRKQFQDKKGIMWFSIEAMGVCRYTGHKFDIYNHNPNKENSLSSNFVNDINQDFDGNMWFATENGLNRLDRNSGEFTVFKYNPSSNNSISNNLINCIERDHEGVFWLGTGNGMVRFDPKNNFFKRYIYKDEKTDDNVQVAVSSIYFDNDSIIWLGTDNGLYKLNPFNGESVIWNINNKETNNLIDERIECIEKDQNGDLWLGTHRGLERFNTQTNTFTHWRYKNDNDIEDLQNEGVNDLFLDKNQSLWVGTYTRGLVLINTINDDYIRITSDENLEYPLKNNHIVDVFEDKEGLIWICTKFSGLAKVIYEKDYFGQWPTELELIKKLQNKYIVSFYEDKNNVYWLGSKFEGLFKIDLNTQKITNHKKILNCNDCISSNRVEGIFRDSKNNLWIGTEQGLDLYIEQSSKFINYSEIPIYKITEDFIGNIWLATLNGVFVVDQKKKRIVRYDDSKYNFFQKNDLDVVYVYSDSYENVWFSTRNNGLYKYNLTLEKLVHLNTEIEFFKKLETNQVRLVMEDHNGNIWIGTKASGLIKYEYKTNKYTRYTTQNGLPSNFILDINEDLSGNIWLGTHNGLSKLNRNKDTFQNYNSDYGLNSNISEIGVSKRLSNGSLIFGGNDGFNIFYPQDIFKTDTVSPIIITSMKIFNKEILKDVEHSRKLNLNFDQNNISFEFALMDYKDPYRHKFSCFMEGVDEDWIELGNRYYCNYTNLDPGKYTFYIKAADEMGNWTQTPLKIGFEISPPFFNTWLFRIIAFLLIVTAFVVTILQRSAQIKNNQDQLEIQIKERTQKLEVAYQELLEKNTKIEEQKKEIEMHRSKLEEKVSERTKDLEEAKIRAEEGDKLKTSFLANMSHEIRTPINAIAGFSNLLEDQETTVEERSNYIQVINDNTNSLLKLIEDILDISKIEARQIKIKKDLFNLNGLFYDLYQMFSDKLQGNMVSSDLKINWTNKASKSKYIAIYTDQVRLKQIIVNLISNAIKYTSKGKIEFGYEINNSDLLIYVKDSGIGISKSDKDIIFNRFVKIEEKSALYRGTGIGLSISKGLVELLNGKIWVESNVGEGSQFYVSITKIIDLETSGSFEKNKAKELNLNLQGKSILIVEDEDSNFFLLNSYLRKTGVNIMRAVDGEDALDIVKSHTFDMILMDINMPRLNGYKALESLRLNYPNLPVIAQTAYAQTEDKQVIIDAGFNDYLAKPIMKMDLLEKIHIHMR